MSNEEQLAILKLGVEVWNQWREGNPDIPTTRNYGLFSPKSICDFPQALDFSHITIKYLKYKGLKPP